MLAAAFVNGRLDPASSRRALERTVSSLVDNLPPRMPGTVPWLDRSMIQSEFPTAPWSESGFRVWVAKSAGARSR